MNKILLSIFLVGLLSIAACTTAPTGEAKKTPTEKPANEPGSVWDILPQELRGEHYTLNIHGKKDGYGCSEPEYDESGNQVYGNSLFIPENGENIQILMESGNQKGKWAEGDTSYGVTDWCTKSFDGDAATVRLPPNNKGYFVVARALAKPTNEPSLTVVPELTIVQDEVGQDLMVLGLVTDNGFESADTTFTRTKGKQKAVDITGLFEWSGDVCYFNGTNYCYDDAQNYLCVDSELCCFDDDLDGLFDRCEVPDYEYLAGSLCSDGTNETTSIACRTYTAEWVFNIGDFVQYLWDTSNSGVKLVQIRFYPVK